MRVVAAWVAIIAILLIATIVSQWWDDRERKRAKAKERISRGLMPTPKQERALEAANRTPVKLPTRKV